MKKYQLTYLLVLFSLVSQAQLTNIPMNQSFRDFFAVPLANQAHSAIQPYNPFETRELVDSIQRSFDIDNTFTKTWLGRKLFNEHMANVQHEDYQFIFNPVFDLRLGRENDNENLLFRNTRGVQVGARVGQKFLIYTDVNENFHFFPQYIRNHISNNDDVVPGQGESKPFTSAGKDDFAFVNGHFDYQASKFLNFRFGHGKNFIGDGYRSLLLSDNAFNYPFLRMTTSFWKIKYVNLFTQMKDRNIILPDRTFARKYVSSHYLSAQVTKRLTLGLYETVVYQDSTGTRGYDINYLNPFILYRPLEFAIGSGGGNVLIGGLMKYQIADHFFIYGQGILDEFKVDEFFSGQGWWALKYGLQGGFKSYNTFTPGLTLQSEINLVRPYTYSHNTSPQNYGHYNESLAHPLGANFAESVTIIRYLKNRYFFEGRFIYAIQGKDTEGSNWGSNVYLGNSTREQDNDNRFFQGNRTTLFFTNITLGYLVNPSNNWRLELSYTYRSITPEIETTTLSADKTHFFQIGMVTRINNHYYDF
ncbi:MAG: hypothetical protein AAGG68_17455 [Bacteroidota bacterium]